MRQLSSVALLLTLCTTSLIVPNLAPSNAQTSPANSANQANQQLLGSWEAKQDDISLTFIFAPDGKLFIMAPLVPNQRRTATKLQYKVSMARKPMHLDIFLPRKNQPVQTIFEYTADGKMRMQLEGTDPGKPRPPQFKDNGTIFEKISDSTALPEGVELISESGSGSRNVPTAQTTVASINRGQQAYFLEKSKFSENLKDLELGEGLTVAGICQTTNSTKKISAMPILSLTTNKITCPADSSSIQP